MPLEFEKKLSTIPEVEIVVVTYNRSVDLLKQLKLLQGLDYSKDHYHVTIVNNNSDDDTKQVVQDFIKENRLSTKTYNLINLSKNIGGSGGFSNGIKQALLKGTAKYIWLLDDDATPQKQTLKKLVHAAELKSGNSIIGGVILDKDNTHIVTEAGARINWWQARQQLLYNGQNIENLPNKPFESDYSSAACMLMPLTLAKELQNFSDFFLHFDDVEWCLRARKAGYKTFIEPSARVTHPNKKNAFRPGIKYYDVRNFLYVSSWHYKAAMPYLFIRFMAKGILSSLKISTRPQGMEIFKALIDFTKNVRGKMK
ncbi:glycosyltransferase [Microbulbifer sp. TRSA005]|uniref:glycosyltransferase n=1 Tax=unclassified Microbulbifer TaxID=2619833 RepID=UPI00403A25FC